MLIAAAVIPAWIFLGIVYSLDRHKEHPRHVLPLYIVGALVVLPAGLCERYLLDLSFLLRDPPSGLTATLFMAFFVAGATEETFKALTFRRLVYHRPFFEEAYDGVVYAVAIGLGFATVENILYVTSAGWATAVVRTFTALPAHTLFGVVTGTLFSRARFGGAPVWPAFALPGLLHGLYDTFALAQTFAANMALIVYLMWLVRFAWTRADALLRFDRAATLA